MNRVDLLITEDRGLHTKAGILGIADRVFTIDAFLEKVTAENPALVDYKVLAVKTTVFGNIDITSSFFDSFRADYGGAAFDKWFARKADETVYVCHEAQDLVAFLYLKVEGPGGELQRHDARVPAEASFEDRHVQGRDERVQTWRAVPEDHLRQRASARGGRDICDNLPAQRRP